MADKNSAAREPDKSPIGGDTKAASAARPPLSLVKRQARPGRQRRPKPPAAPTSFRDEIVAEVLKMVGAPEGTKPLAEDRVAEILPVMPKAITYQDFNEVLMYCDIGPVSSLFFDHFFGDGFQTVDSVKNGVTNIRKYSFLFHGNFERGFEELRRTGDATLFSRPPWDLSPIGERSQMAVDRIVPLKAEEAFATGYLTGRHSLKPPEVGKARKKASANADRYMAMNGVDVYVAGSMRELPDFEEAEALVESVKAMTAPRGLRLTLFNPLWAQMADPQQKGLLEVLMLRKASAMLFIAGAKDSFGKDSELSTMLVQGKPVVVYVPSPSSSDARYADFEKRFKMFLEHPLRMQADLRTGVANGVMVARAPEVCAELLVRLFTNTMEFEIDDSDQHNHYLREKLTGSSVRVITRSQLLTGSFWQQYLGDDPRRL